MNCLFRLQKKVESISINHKNDQRSFLRFINAICLSASVASAIFLLFSGSVIMTLWSHCPCVVPYTVGITWNSTGVAVTDLFRPGHAVVQSVLVKCLHKWLWAIYQWSLHFLYTVKTNEATLSGLEPITSVMAGPSAPADKPTTGLVLGCGLPSIPADLLKVTEGSYIELSGFLSETIQESFLYPDGRKKKLSPIDEFTDWVLAFCCFGLASLQANSEFGGDLLTFIGTVARLARDHPGPAWAVYEQAFQAKMAANPSLHWNK